MQESEDGIQSRGQEAVARDLLLPGCKTQVCSEEEGSNAEAALKQDYLTREGWDEEKVDALFSCTTVSKIPLLASIGTPRSALL